MKMSEEKNTGCSGNCASCGESCASRESQSLIEPTGEYNNIKHVLAVVSGKGGVGKSMTASMLAVLLKRMGRNVGILDADITGRLSLKPSEYARAHIRMKSAFFPRKPKRALR